MDSLFQDLRYAVRSLSKSPGFAASAVVALALGIGANTAIFSVVNGVLLRPLPYKDEGRLVVVLHDGNNPVSPGNFVDWRSQSQAYERMGAAEYWTPNLTGTDEPEKLWALRLTSDVFPLLGVEPFLGRAFLPEEAASGRDHVVVLSHGLWQRRFAGDPRILGRALTLNDETYTVVGVMPRGFRLAPFWATRAELWSPLALGDRVASRGGNSLRVFARLKPGVDLEQARAEMAMVTGRLEQAYPGTNRRVTVLSLKEKVVGSIRQPLLVLLGAVGFVLLIACANVAHMLLARAAMRQREVAVRTALGASRSRLVRQHLTESLVLALCGGAAGVLLAYGLTRVLVWLSPASIPRLDDIGLDGRVLAVTLFVSLVTGIVAGLVPALQASAADPSQSLKEGERGSTEGRDSGRLRHLLMASEFGLALVLSIGAALMIRSFHALQAIDPGFEPRNVLSLAVSVAGSGRDAAERRSAFVQQLVQRIVALPGVRSASAINHLPLAGDIWGFPFWVEGRPIPGPGDGNAATYRVALPGYFRTMGIDILRGRDIAPADTRNAPGVVVVNQQLAKQLWPGEDAIGKRITLDNPERRQPAWLTIVGVVENAKRGRWTEAASNELYVPYLQSRNYLEDSGSHVGYMTFVVRTEREPAALMLAVRSVVAAADKNATISEVQTMEHVVAAAIGEPRFYLLLLGAFAAVALTLAAEGIYGVMSYSVSRRTHEIGIRMALGARPAQVLRLVVAQGMAGAALGACLGLAAALALTRLMAGLLYEVAPMDPATFAAVALVLAAVALAASYLPARRATRIEPLSALRHE